MQTLSVYPFSIIFVHRSNLGALMASSRMGWVFKFILSLVILCFF